MRKNILIVLFIAVSMLIGVGSVKAASISAETSLLSGYLLDSGWMTHDDLVSQSSVGVSFENGFHADVWVSTDLNDSRFASSEGDEIDYAVGWAKRFGDSEVDLTTSYFHLYKGEAEEDEDGNIFEPPSADMFQLSAKLGYIDNVMPSHTLKPWVKVDVLNSVKSDGPKGGSYVHMGLTHDWQISESVSFEQELKVVYDSGVYGADDGFVSAYDIYVSYVFAEMFYVSASGKLTAPLTVYDERGAEAAGGIAIGLEF